MPVQSDPLEMLSSSLTRLNFFDGMFLRAELLRREQSGMRSLVFQSNLADGGGIAFGLDAAVDGDTVTVSPGLAIDGEGRVLLLEGQAQADLSDLLGTRTVVEPPKGKGRFEACVDVVPPSRTVVAGSTTFYAIVLHHRESACGWEEVQGRACEDACDASMERPYLVESARIRLCPVTIESTLPASHAVVLTDTHLRSRVASAFYAYEQAASNPLISESGLRSSVWCRGATPLAGICGSDVPVALLAMRAGSVLFVDPWIVRRERMETPPRRYWAGRVRMRPWDVYLAQVLQFQCQLSEVVGAKDGDVTTPADPCGEAHDVIGETLTVIEALQKGIHEIELTEVPLPPVPGGGEAPAGAPRRLLDPQGSALGLRLATVGGVGKLDLLRDRLTSVLKPGGRARRILLSGGVVETPPAGWLPVDPKAARPLTQQVADLLGDGVDLRFCAIRADQAAGEFESCQHLDRISLVRGIDDPARKERVDILVPDAEAGAAAPTKLLEVELALSPRPVRVRDGLSVEAAGNRVQIPLKGVGRLDGGPGMAVYGAFTGGLPNRSTARAATGFIADSVRGDRVTRRVNFGERAVNDADVSAFATAARNRFGAAAPAPAASEPRALAVWVELTLDRNPLTLGQGGRGRCAVDLRAVSPASQGQVFSVDADGEFRVKDIEEDGSVVVAVKGLVARVDEQGAKGPDQFDLTFSINAASGSVRMTGDADLTAEWSGSPLKAKAEISAHLSLGALARQSEDAARPGNQYHDRALAALTVFEAVQAGFAKAATEKLFGARAGSGALTTQHDWVLFRRRTTYDCATVAAPVPVKDGEVDVWHALADGRQHGERVIEAVRGGDFKHPWRRVTTARFVGETAQLRTSSPDLRDAWQASEVDGGNLVLFGGYAGTGAFVQPAAVDRVHNLVQGLAPAAVLDGDPASDLVTLGQPPAEFVHAGSDGAVFLVSLQEVKAEATCALLLRVDDQGDDDDEGTWAAIIQPDESAIKRLIREGRLREVGTVARRSDGMFALEDAVVDALSGRAGLPATVWVPADIGLDEEQAGAFATEGLEQVAENVDVRAIVRDDFRYEREPCPMLLFVRLARDR